MVCQKVCAGSQFSVVLTAAGKVSMIYEYLATCVYVCVCVCVCLCVCVCVLVCRVER